MYLLPYFGEMKVLIIHVAPAGDVVFSTPLIRGLKVHLDDAELYYVTSSAGAVVLEENPYLEKVYDSTLAYRDTWYALRKHRFDVVIDLTATLAAAFLTLFTRARIFRSKKRSMKTWFDLKKKNALSNNTHLVERYIDTVRPLGIEMDDLRLDYTIPYKDEVPASWLPDGFQKGFVTFCVQAPYATRKLPVNRIIELCDKINRPIILLGGKEDADVGDQISRFFERTENSAEWEEGLQALNKKTVVYNGCGKFNFHQMASVVRQARYVFTFDNDLLPVASAFGKETFSIWGNTVLQFGRYPYHTKFTVLENNRLSCRPCSEKGYPRCPLKHFKCMNEIVFDFYLP